MKNWYEMTLIIAISAEEDKLLDKVTKLIEDGGKIEKKDKWGKKTLAYPIKKETEGMYWHLVFELGTDKITSVSDKLRMEEKILRFLVVTKSSEKSEKKS